MMTFAEMVETTTQELYPSDVTDDFKNTVFDWFQYREVADDQKFPVWFRRVISRDYGRYLQLLRVEPGISQYDWLVQKYEEAMSTNQRAHEDTISKSSNSSISQGGTVTDAGTSSKNSTKTIERTEAGEDDTTFTKTAQGSDDKTDTLSGTDTRTDNLSHGISETTTKSSSNVLDSDVTVIGSNDTTSKDLGRANPMSASYSAGGFPSTFDWQNPSSQNETQENASNTSTTERDDTTTLSGTDTKTGTNTDTGTVATQYGKKLVSERDITNTETDTTDRDTSKTVNASEVGSDTGTSGNTRTLDTITTTENSGEDTSSGLSNEVVRAIHTGRNIDTATLLRNASDFIKGSSAWEWMSLRLETCFIGIY